MQVRTMLHWQRLLRSTIIACLLSSQISCSLLTPTATLLPETVLADASCQQALLHAAQTLPSRLPTAEVELSGFRTKLEYLQLFAESSPQVDAQQLKISVVGIEPLLGRAFLTEVIAETEAMQLHFAGNESSFGLQGAQAEEISLLYLLGASNLGSRTFRACAPLEEVVQWSHSAQGATLLLQKDSSRSYEFHFHPASYELALPETIRVQP